MENLDKILELLEKSNLTPEEEKMLASMGQDKEAANLIAGYLKLKNTLNKEHISIDEMADYILYKQSNPNNGKNVSYRIPAIEAHMKECRNCAKQVQELRDEYKNIEGFVGTNLYSNSKDKPGAVNQFFLKKYFGSPAYALAGIVVLGLVYLGLFALSGVLTPDNYKFAAITEDSEEYLTRGRNTESFIKSFEALESEDYDLAVQFLKQDIESNPDDETIFYSHYILGLTYLDQSENRILGLFPSYDEASAKQGVEHLKYSIDKNTSGRFNNIRLDAYFYLAKGYLMLNNEKTAKEYLQLVVAEKGGKMNEAAEILEELE